MPSVKENFDKHFAGVNPNLSFEGLAETLEKRPLFPIEKVWIESSIFNEIYTTIGHLTVKVDSELIQKIFGTRIAQEICQHVADIYNKYKQKLETQGSNPKGLKSFRMLALLQNFDETYSPKFLDKIYSTTLEGGEKYQDTKFRPIIKYVFTIHAIPGVPMPLDSIEKDDKLKLINFLRFLKNNRQEGGIEW